MAARAGIEPTLSGSEPEVLTVKRPGNMCVFPYISACAVGAVCRLVQGCKQPLAGFEPATPHCYRINWAFLSHQILFTSVSALTH